MHGRAVSRIVGVLALALVVIGSDVASAQRGGERGGRGGQGPGGFRGQPPGGGFGRGPGMMGMGMGGPGQGMTLPTLLMMENVQRDLGLSAEQVDQVTEVGEQIQSAVRESMREMFQGGGFGPGQGGDPAAMRERFAAMQQQVQKLRDELDKEATAALAKVLNAEQKERANQIFYQAQGVQAFLNPKVVEKLELTSRQREQVEQVIAQSRDQLRQAMGGFGRGGQEGRGGQGGRPGQPGGNEGGRRPDFREMAQRMQEMQQETMEKALEVLTDAQKDAWKEMTGKPIELRPGGFGGRRGRGGDRVID